MNHQIRLVLETVTTRYAPISDAVFRIVCENISSASLLLLSTVHEYNVCFSSHPCLCLIFGRLSLHFLGLPVLLRPVGDLSLVIFTILSSVIRLICSFHFLFLSSTQSLILSIPHVCLVFSLLFLSIGVFPLFSELFSFLWPLIFFLFRMFRVEFLLRRLIRV